ncbi:MAG TPA: tetratricopeptide repeat protein, partial [Nitrospiria bacterium]
AVQREGVIHSLSVLSPGVRLGNTAVSYAAYIEKTLWPRDMAPFYPYSPENLSMSWAAGSALLLLFITAAVFRMATRRPYLFFGWLWFLVSLLPVIGIVQAGTQSMADRYTYIPLIGLFVMAAWGVREAAIKWKPAGKILIVLSAVALLSLGIKARVQADHWRNSEALFSHALRVTADNEQAYHGMGIERLEQGRFDEAIGFFLEAVRIDPGFERAHVNLGNAYLQKGEPHKARDHYHQALLLNPDSEVAYNNLGLASYQGERKEEALNYFHQAIKRNPGYSDSYTNIGIVLFREGSLKESAEYFQNALSLNPEDSSARGYLEKIKAQTPR